jgi:hypothetical protein
MPATWKHPQLGEFRFEHGHWQKGVLIPAFDAFDYLDLGEKAPGGEEYSIAFDTEDDSELPSEAEIAVVLRILSNQASLVTAIANALWDDFNGKGPNSGMWWHGDLDQVAEQMFAEQPLKSPEEVVAALKATQITIRTDLGNAPLAEIDFQAPFEDEHGLSVLTDGSKVVGIGFIYDVMPFDWVEKYLAGEIGDESED